MNSQDFWEFWRMRRQCVPGSLFPPPESEPGFEATTMVHGCFIKLCTAVLISSEYHYDVKCSAQVH